MLLRLSGFFALAMFLVPGASLAQEADGQVAGALQRAGSGEPIAGAVVRLDELDRVQVTDADGRFRFAGVSAGSYTIEIVSLGRVLERRTVAVTAGEVEELAIALSPELVDAPEIRVVLDRLRAVGGDAREAEIAGAAHVVDAEDLAALPNLYDDVHVALRTVPGVYVTEEEGFGLRPNIGLRGSGSDRSAKVTLMEDGVLIAPAPYTAPAAYYFPVLGRMDAIEVRKGSSQVRYGPQTIGGAVNLVSSPIPESLSWEADLEGGSETTGKAYLRIGDSYANAGWLVETYQARTDGFKRLDSGGDTGFDIADYLLKGRVRTDADARVYQELELKLHVYDEISNETYLGLTDEAFDVDPLRRYAASQRDQMDAEQTQVQLRHFLRPSVSVDLTTVAYRNDFHRNWYKLDSVLGEPIADVLDDPDAFPEALAILEGADSPDGALDVRANNREYYAAGVQSILGLRLDGRAGVHDVEVGVRWHEDEEDRFQHDDAYRMASGRLERTEAGAPGSQSNRVSDATAWSIFVQDGIGLGRWTVTPGVRFESIDFTRTDYAADDPDRTVPSAVRENEVSAWIPGAGASWQLAEGVRLFGGVHRGFAPPGPGADPDAEPEESVNWELGAKLDRAVLRAQLVGFFSDYDNILGRATLSSGDPVGDGQTFNGGAAEVAGLELAVEFDAGALAGAGVGVPLAIAWTWTHAEFRTSFQSEFEPWGSVEAGDELPYLPDHQLSASAGLVHGPWDGRVLLQASSEMRTVAGHGAIPDGEGTDAFGVWSAQLGYAVSPWATVTAGVENLTDATYIVARRPAGARPGLPRTLMLGIRLAN